MSTFPLSLLENEVVLIEVDKAIFIKNTLGIGYPLSRITQAVRELGVLSSGSGG